MLLNNKLGRRELLLDLFRQYSDDLLSLTFEAMKSDGLITKCKVRAGQVCCSLCARFTINQPHNVLMRRRVAACGSYHGTKCTCYLATRVTAAFKCRSGELM